MIADHEGDRWLGREANWVRDVRAPAGRAVLRQGRRADVVLEDVDPSLRAAIPRRHLELARGGRAHLPIDQGAPLEQFEHYPVFRIRVE